MSEGKWNLGGDSPRCFTHWLLLWFVFFQTPTFDCLHADAQAREHSLHAKFSVLVSFFRPNHVPWRLFTGRLRYLFLWSFFVWPLFSVVMWYKFTHKLSSVHSQQQSYQIGALPILLPLSTENTCSMQALCFHFFSRWPPHKECVYLIRGVWRLYQMVCVGGG